MTEQGESEGGVEVEREGGEGESGEDGGKEAAGEERGDEVVMEEASTGDEKPIPEVGSDEEDKQSCYITSRSQVMKWAWP